MLKFLNRVLPLLVVLCTGCAWTEVVHSPSQAEWLAVAQRADGERRQAMWASLSGIDNEAERLVRRAWLMALPGHEGHDPQAASARLRELMPSLDDEVVRAMFAGRAELLDELRQCRVQSSNLQRRLTRIIEIEQNLQSDE